MDFFLKRIHTLSLDIPKHIMYAKTLTNFVLIGQVMTDAERNEQRNKERERVKEEMKKFRQFCMSLTSENKEGTTERFILSNMKLTKIVTSFPF